MLKQHLELKRLVDVYYDVQDVRVRTANRLRSMPQETVAVYPKRLKDVEKDLKKQIEALLRDEKIYVEWLQKIKGIGPCLAGGLVSNIAVRFATVKKLDDCTELQKLYVMKTRDKNYLVPEVRGIEAFSTVSKLWAFCGLSVIDGKAPKRTKGKTVNWSPKMRVLCWKIGKSFVMVGDFYSKLYRQIKKKYLETHKHILKEKGGKGHIDAMARRKTVKIFLQHLWVRWRQLEGLEVSEPYAMRIKGHDDYIPSPV